MKYNESMLDAAVAVLEANEGSMAFLPMWKKICERLEISEEEAAGLVGRFYTDLSFFGKIVMLKDKSWDLRERHKMEEYHVSAASAYLDVEESSDRDQTDIQEDKEYDQSVLGGVVTEENEEEIYEEENEGGQTREREAATEALGLKDNL